MDTQWLVSIEDVPLDDPSVQIVDVREAWEYDAIGHLPGAVNIPFEQFRDDASADPGTLPGQSVFESLLGESGIGPEDRIIAYDDTHGVFAARLLLTAIAYGHTNVSLLDGDFSAWKRTRAVSNDTPEVDPVDYSRPPVGLDRDGSPLVDTETVESLLESGTVTLIDTREAHEYAAGHLPGAIRLDWMELVDTESRGIRPAAEIEAVLEERGIPTDRDQPIVLYCNTARRLSHTYVVLRSIGFEDVRVYEGSLAVWDGPLEGDTDE